MPPPDSPICYAQDANGQRLPVIDVTHPAFAVRLSEAELAARVAAHQHRERLGAKQPRWMQRLIYFLFLRKSELGRRLRAASGGFLDGMSTYRLKLGPHNLDPSWAAPIDRRIAASLPCLSLRLRLQDMAEFLADDLAPRLAAQPGKPLHLVNIAGGPSSDSLNALLLLEKRDPALLHGRRVQIDLFDQDEIGPGFAARALSALQAPAAPLAPVAVALEHFSYRWDDVAPLRDQLACLPPEAITVASSEGGLFDYGSDEEIVANLAVLRDALPGDTAIAGSLTRAKVSPDRSPLRVRFSTRARDLPDFSPLVDRAGWRIAASRTRPYQINVLLKRAAPALAVGPA